MSKREAPKQKAGQAVQRPFRAALKAKSQEAKLAKKAPPAPKAPPPERKAVSLPSDDADAFRIAMAGVQAIGRGRDRIPRSQSRVDRRPPPAPAPHDESAELELAALVVTGLSFEITDDGERLEGRRLELDPRALRRLRHGRGVVDGKIDLHGQDAAAARRTLERFLKERRSAGDRLLLVVHGKGIHSPDGRGVLRGEIGAWLSQGPAARHVAAFATPPPELGGEGALLVLLIK